MPVNYGYDWIALEMIVFLLPAANDRHRIDQNYLAISIDPHHRFSDHDTSFLYLLRLHQSPQQLYKFRMWITLK